MLSIQEVIGSRVVLLSKLLIFAPWWCEIPDQGRTLKATTEGFALNVSSPVAGVVCEAHGQWLENLYCVSFWNSTPSFWKITPFPTLAMWFEWGLPVSSWHSHVTKVIGLEWAPA